MYMQIQYMLTHKKTHVIHTYTIQYLLYNLFHHAQIAKVNVKSRCDTHHEGKEQFAIRTCSYFSRQVTNCINCKTHNNLSSLVCFFRKKCVIFLRKKKIKMQDGMPYIYFFKTKLTYLPMAYAISLYETLKNLKSFNDMCVANNCFLNVIKEYRK